MSDFGYPTLPPTYKDEILQYYKDQENSTSGDVNSTTVDPEPAQKISSYQKKAAALIGATAAGTYLYKKHQENKDSVLRIQKSWHGFKPLGNTIWQAIEEKTSNRITRETHTYSIVDCKTDWEITFAAK